jgi:hypothetical protein
MKLKARLSILAMLLPAGGCGSSGGDAPPAPGGAGPEVEGPPAPGGAGNVGGSFTSGLGGCSGGDGGGMGRIWLGGVQTGENEEMRLLIAETGEFRWLPGDGWYQQILGTFQATGTNVSSTDAVWVWVDGLTFLETRFESVDMWGELNEQGDLAIQYQFDSNPSLTETHSFTACDSLYRRESSLAVLAGAYTGLRDNDSLAIDSRGLIFYQNARTGCVGNGSAELIDPDFNMYRGAIEFENCTAELAIELNGLTFTGLGYLGDSGDGVSNDIVEFAFTAATGSGFVMWDMVARR